MEIRRCKSSWRLKLLIISLKTESDTEVETIKCKINLAKTVLLCALENYFNKNSWHEEGMMAPVI